jgi:hypothetical protein
MADSMVARYLHARERATANGDRRLVAECDFQLGRLGHEVETTVTGAPPEDATVGGPARRGPGRPRKDLAGPDAA